MNESNDPNDPNDGVEEGQGGLDITEAGAIRGEELRPRPFPHLHPRRLVFGSVARDFAEFGDARAEERERLLGPDSFGSSWDGDGRFSSQEFARLENPGTESALDLSPPSLPSPPFLKVEYIDFLRRTRKALQGL